MMYSVKLVLSKLADFDLHCVLFNLLFCTVQLIGHDME